MGQNYPCCCDEGDCWCDNCTEESDCDPCIRLTFSGIRVSGDVDRCCYCQRFNRSYILYSHFFGPCKTAIVLGTQDDHAVNILFPEDSPCLYGIGAYFTISKEGSDTKLELVVSGTGTWNKIVTGNPIDCNSTHILTLDGSLSGNPLLKCDWSNATIQVELFSSICVPTFIYPLSVGYNGCICGTLPNYMQVTIPSGHWNSSCLEFGGDIDRCTEAEGLFVITSYRSGAWGVEWKYNFTNAAGCDDPPQSDTCCLKSLEVRFYSPIYYGPTSMIDVIVKSEFTSIVWRKTYSPYEQIDCTTAIEIPFGANNGLGCVWDGTSITIQGILDP